MNTSLACAWLAASGAVSAQSTAPDSAAEKVAASICAACHGPAGVSRSPLFPRLAGQKEIYLAAQLKAFKA
ncbi:MAG: cytochrome c, partial [Pseudomonadota bacterium]|nr:cytochrome c [Pseudomonadota bacterium]